jgi:CubicO group peptidase (beta-lactamase class C family)
MKTLKTEASARALIQELESRIPDMMERTSIPGLALSLVRARKPYWEQAFGVRNRVTQEPVTLETVFEAASLSKPVFAYAALQLVQEGVLDLDAPLDEYTLEPYVPDDPRLKLITARRVLCHSPGFPNWRREGDALRIYFTPGARFSYSGEGYVYLQKVVEHVSGQTAAEFVQSRVFTPHGMRHSSLLWTGEENLAVAVGHDKQGEAQEKRLWPSAHTAAGLHCTARDLARFMCVVMKPSAKEAARLGPELNQEMLSPQIQTNDGGGSWQPGWPDAKVTVNERVSWGLGWGLQKTAEGDSFWHWGDNGCYRAFAIGSAQEGQALAIMTNGQNGQQVINWMLRDVLGGEYPALDWMGG